MSGSQTVVECRSNKISILVTQQKLLYLGKILQDTSTVKDYKLADNAKLMLTRVPKPDLKRVIYTHFSRYYDVDTSTQLTNQFMENMKQKLKSYSVDDLERLAEVFIKESES